MKEFISRGSIHIDFIEPIKGDHTYKLEGYYLATEPIDEIKISIQTSMGEVPTIPVRRSDLLDDESFYYGFEVVVKLESRDRIGFLISHPSGKVLRPKIHTGPFTYMSPLVSAYSRVGVNQSLFRKFPRQLTYRPEVWWRHLTYEAAFWMRLLFYWRMDNVKVAVKGIIHSTEKRSLKKLMFEIVKPVLIIIETLAKVPQAYLLRSLVLYSRTRKQKPIWIISDRGMAAGDNGEALYRYIIDHEQPNADVYFVLAKKSSDYQRLEKLAGEMLLDQDSLRYKLKFLLADKIISSHADIEVTNPFLRQRYHYQDLMTHQFIFLQHGVIRHDHSVWLNRYQKNIQMFVTSAQKEYDSILEYGYGYDANKVVLTGLPRFDYLESEPKGKLILAPTYRRELARLPTNKNGARPYDPQFKISEYYQVYSSLLNDERLTEALNASNMTIELYLHPNLHAQAKDFNKTDVVRVKEYPYSYKDAFKEGNILITDYSSVSFDFAYLNKPIVYYQYDSETFFDHSLSEKADFFSDEHDGFGPVVTEHNELVDILINLIETNKNPELYTRRINNFFYKIDKNNSRRVYEAILALDS